MANTNLKCSAHNCGYNNSGDCYAGGINVDGKSATTTSNTVCSSFIDKANGEFTNSSSSENCVCTENIKCEAYNCKYNENESCNANQVKINANNASCETFCSK